MAGAGNNSDPMLSERIRVPEHVVYRDFGDETVILNLKSGQYHGLNHTAAEILGALSESDSVAAAIDKITAELGVEHEVIERDVLLLCRALEERSLIERHAAGN